MNENIEVYRFECLYSKNQLNIERYMVCQSSLPQSLSFLLAHNSSKNLLLFCAIRGRGCVPVMLVGRGVGDAEGAGAAAGRARRLAIATRGAGAPRSLAAVLTRAPRSAPYRISSVLMGTEIDAENRSIVS